MVRTAALPGWSCEPGRPAKSRSQTGGLSPLSSFRPSALRPSHTWLWPKDMAGRSGEQPGLAAWSPAASPTHSGPAMSCHQSSLWGLCCPPYPPTSARSLPDAPRIPNPLPPKCDQKFNVVQPLSALHSCVSHRGVCPCAHPCVHPYIHPGMCTSPASSNACPHLSPHSPLALPGAAWPSVPVPGAVICRGLWAEPGAPSSGAELRSAFPTPPSRPRGWAVAEAGGSSAPPAGPGRAGAV